MLGPFSSMNVEEKFEARVLMEPSLLVRYMRVASRLNLRADIRLSPSSNNSDDIQPRVQSLDDDISDEPNCYFPCR